MKLVILAPLLIAACGPLTLPDGSQFPSGSIAETDVGILGADKGKHLIAGMAVATTTRVLATEYTTWERREVVMAGCAASATVGIAKEFYDRDIMGTRFEVADAFYTAAGCLFTFEWVF